MSVYKELILMAELVERSSGRVFEDAADYGVTVESEDDSILKQLKGLIEMYEGVVVTDRYPTGATQSIIIKGLDEWNTHKEFEIVFKYVHINKDSRRKYDPHGYIFVEKNGYADILKG